MGIMCLFFKYVMLHLHSLTSRETRHEAMVGVNRHSRFVSRLAALAIGSFFTHESKGLADDAGVEFIFALSLHSSFNLMLSRLWLANYLNGLV